jgi:hypothetical protein
VYPGDVFPRKAGLLSDDAELPIAEIMHAEDVG